MFYYKIFSINKMVQMIGGNITDTITGYVGKIDPKYLKIIGMILVVISVICIVYGLFQLFMGKNRMSVDYALNTLMDISAFIAGIYMWKSGGNALSSIM